MGCGNYNFLFYNAWQAGCRSSSGVGVFSFWRRDSTFSLEIQSVAIMRWTSEERAFAVEAYFSNRLFVIATQRAFRNRFNVAPRDPVPDRKSVVTWVTSHYVLAHREYDTTKNCSISAHQII